MKILLAALLVTLGLAGCANAGSVTIDGSLPDQDNSNKVCGTTPVLTPMAPGNLVTMHASWTGTSAGQDSLSPAAAGAPFTFGKSLPAGPYTFHVWFSDAGGAGCDTTFAFTVRKDPPWKKPVNAH